jgi:hypothetical protein
MIPGEWEGMIKDYDQLCMAFINKIQMMLDLDQEFGRSRGDLIAALRQLYRTMGGPDNLTPENVTGFQVMYCSELTSTWISYLKKPGEKQLEFPLIANLTEEPDPADEWVMPFCEFVWEMTPYESDWV